MLGGNKITDEGAKAIVDSIESLKANPPVALYLCIQFALVIPW